MSARGAMGSRTGREPSVFSLKKWGCGRRDPVMCSGGITASLHPPRRRRLSWDEPQVAGWERWASAFLPEQSGERTLARVCCGLKIMNHVQSSSFIQAENQREHLQPRVKSWPCTLLPIPPCTHSMTPSGKTRHVPLPLLPPRVPTLQPPLKVH